MKAIVVREVGEPEVMRLEEAPDPQPGPGQVVVKVHAAGVNPVDAYFRSGAYYHPDLPYTPGSDAAGVIEAVGEGVTGLAVGDRVYTSGTLTGAYAEKALCEVAQVHGLPERVSFSQGAGVNVPYGTAYRALFQRAGARPGEIVLVHGATGGVGIAAVQLARAAGMTVIGTAGGEEGRRLAADQGAHHVLDHQEAGHFQQALDLTGGRGVDVIIELAAHANLDGDLRMLARNGRVAVIGARGRVEIDPRATMGPETEIRGVTYLSATDRESAAIHAAIGAGLAAGTLQPVVGKVLPLAEAPAAHHAIMEGRAHGKIVLVP